MIGQTVGHYEILEKIGEGGMGVVYRARDIWLDRSVALKFLSRELVADADLKARFIQEAKAASALDHPSICTIHTIDENDEGQLFIAMAYYEGETVKAKMRRGLMSPQEIVEIACQVASGLQAAHERGIVHLDVKPANIMVTRDGSVKILDFGLSRFTSQVSERSHSGPLMGTVAYMSPERVQGEPAGAESDIWSLGVVLYEMATGTRPFHGGSDMSVLYAVVHREFVPAIEMVPELPMEFDRIIRRCLLKDRRYRYRTVGQLLADLENLQQTAQAMTATVPWIYHRPWRTGSRAQRLALTAVGAVVLLVLMGGALLSVKRVFIPPESQLGIFALDPEPILLSGFLNQGAAEDDWIGMSLSELLDAEMDDLIRVGWAGPAPDVQVPAEMYTLKTVFDPERGFAPAVLEEIPEDGLVRVVAAGAYELEGETLRVRLMVQDRMGEILATISREGPVQEPFGLVAGLADDLIEKLNLAAPPRPVNEPVPPLLPPTSENLEKAQAHLRRLEGQPARELLEEALQSAPQSTTLHLNLAEALLLLARKEEAAEAARDAISYARNRRQRFEARTLLVEAQGINQRAIAGQYILWMTRDEEKDELSRGLKLAGLLARGNQGAAAGVLLASLEKNFPDDPRIALGQANAIRDISRHKQLDYAQRVILLGEEQEAPMVVARGYHMAAEANIHMGRFEPAIEILNQALEIYAQHEDPQGEALILNQLGAAFESVQRLSEAKTSFERAAQLWGSIGNRRSQSRATINQAIILLTRGDYGAAIEILGRSLELTREINDEFGLAGSYSYLAEAQSRIGDFAAAEKSFNEALPILSKMDRPGWLATTLVIYGEHLMARGELEEAARALSRADDLHQRTGQAVGRSRALNGRATLLLLQGKLEEAHQVALQIRNIRDEDDPLQAAQAEVTLGLILLHSNDLHEAGRKIESALQILDGLADPVWSARARLILIKLFLAQGRIAAAKDLSRRVLVDLIPTGAVVDLAHGHVALAHCLVLEGDLVAAQQSIDEAERSLQGVDSQVAKLPLGMVRARLLLAQERYHDARATVDPLLAVATTRGLTETELELQLLIAEIYWHSSGNPNRLLALAQEADSKGFLLLAGKARRLTETLSDGPTERSNRPPGRPGDRPGVQTTDRAFK